MYTKPSQCIILGHQQHDCKVSISKHHKKHVNQITHHKCIQSVNPNPLMNPVIKSETHTNQYKLYTSSQ